MALLYARWEKCEGHALMDDTLVFSRYSAECHVGAVHLVYCTREAYTM